MKSSISFLFFCYLCSRKLQRLKIYLSKLLIFLTKTFYYYYYYYFNFDIQIERKKKNKRNKIWKRKQDDLYIYILVNKFSFDKTKPLNRRIRFFNAKKLKFYLQKCLYAYYLNIVLLHISVKEIFFVFK